MSTAGGVKPMTDALRREFLPRNVDKFNL